MGSILYLLEEHMWQVVGMLTTKIVRVGVMAWVSWRLGKLVCRG